DVGDDVDVEVEDVGAVEAAAEADLADHQVRLALFREEDSGGGQHLERGRLQLLGQLARLRRDPADQVGKPCFGDHFAVADVALAVRHEVRFGQQHGVQPCNPAHRV